MKHTLWWSLTAIALLSLGACATTGDIAIDLGADNTFFISPENQDGIQDTFSVPASVIPVERSVIQYYRVEVVDVGGNPVYSVEETAPRGGFFWQRRRQSVETPEIVIWDGTTAEGAWAVDGPYRVAFEVRDSRNRSERLEDIVVFVDNRAPFVEPSVSYPEFSPNGDGRLDTITFFQRRSSIEERWIGELLDGSGAVVRTWEWSGGATDLVWDGTDASGTVVSSGRYSYRVSSTDRAGNTGTYGIPEIVLDTVPRSVAVSVDKEHFSPNGDGSQDTVTFTITGTSRESVSSARLTVVDVAGNVVRNLPVTTGTTSVAFDGRDDDRRVLRDGLYRAVLDVEHTNGDSITTASPIVELDTIPPRVAVSADYRIFSPDADGRRDTITFRQSSGFEMEIVGEIVASDGTAVRRYDWNGAAADLTWDGTDETGVAVRDGVYSYRVSSLDAAGNSGRTLLEAIRLDTRPTPVAVRASATGFSPNGDGRYDGIDLSLSTSSDATIDLWTLEVRSAGGDVVFRTEGRDSLPSAPIEWNGRTAAGPASDGTYGAFLTVEFEKGNLSTATSESFVVDTTAPVVQATLSQGLFSPDGDGVRDQLTVDLTVRDPSMIADWSATILDPTGREFWTQVGVRPVPRRLTWDGRSPTGELVQSASRYPLAVVVTDVYGNSGRAEAAIDTDILVMRDGDVLRIVLSNINFAPNTADYLNLAPEIAAANVEALDRVYEVLRRYPTYDIRIEGHAVSVLWEDPPRAQREQEQVLLPLSLARAEAIKRALVQRGINAARITTRGFGGAFPVVPHGDEANRWKSRRVEFVLQER